MSTDRLLTTNEASAYLKNRFGQGHGTPATLAALRPRGKGPAFRKIGPSKRPGSERAK